MQENNKGQGETEQHVSIVVSSALFQDVLWNFYVPSSDNPCALYTGQNPYKMSSRNDFIQHFYKCGDV